MVSKDQDANTAGGGGGGRAGLICDSPPDREREFSQPSSGLDAALGESFATRGKANVGDDAALVILSPSHDAHISREVDSILKDVEHLRDFPKALNLDQLENALARLQSMPCAGPREISNVPHMNRNFPQPDCGIDAALGSAFMSQGHANVGDDGAIVRCPTHVGEKVNEAFSKEGSLEALGHALSYADLTHLVDKIREEIARKTPEN